MLGPAMGQYFIRRCFTVGWIGQNMLMETSWMTLTPADHFVPAVTEWRPPAFWFTAPVTPGLEDHWH